MSDPWFNLYRAPGRISITPCSAKGWLSLIALLLVILLPLLWVIPNTRLGLWVPLTHLAFSAVVVAAFVRFAWTRSEVIDVGRLIREDRAWRAQAGQRRGRDGGR